MSTSTLERTLATEALDEAVESREDGWSHTKTLRHEDGSVTVIKVEEYVEQFHSPRSWDGNVCRMVMKHRDYIDLDDADYGIEEARERWGEESPLVARYLRIFRPDVLAYEPRWEVNGHSQGDWAYGYAFVLQEDWDEWMGDGYEGDVTPEQGMKSEISLYGTYFAGDVYYGIHLKVGDPIVTYGEHGAYVSGYKVDEDTCGGFLGYDDLAEIAQHFTSSPVVR